MQDPEKSSLLKSAAPSIVIVFQPKQTFAPMQRDTAHSNNRKAAGRQHYRAAARFHDTDHEGFADWDRIIEIVVCQMSSGEACLPEPRARRSL